MYAQAQPPNHVPHLQFPPSWLGQVVREPVFQVRVMKHTGALMLWINQGSTVTGTYSQCDAAIRAAQLHCLLVGWWSPVSLFLMNWLALLVNFSARKTLQRNASQARAQTGHAPQMAAHPGATWGLPPQTR
jgi:hypothetical protein